jgi:hypothetical protein
LKAAACPICGSPQHGMLHREPLPPLNSSNDPNRKSDGQ